MHFEEYSELHEFWEQKGPLCSFNDSPQAVHNFCIDVAYVGKKGMILKRTKMLENPTLS